MTLNTVKYNIIINIISTVIISSILKTSPYQTHLFTSIGRTGWNDLHQNNHHTFNHIHRLYCNSVSWWMTPPGRSWPMVFQITSMSRMLLLPTLTRPVSRGSSSSFLSMLPKEITGIIIISITITFGLVITLQMSLSSSSLHLHHHSMIFKYNLFFTVMP